MPDRIGNYQIDGELGEGAFGRVYRAMHPSMGWPVAVKVLKDNDPALLSRFRAEAGVTRKLQHKNIVTVYDFGEQNGAPYIVMELLEGESLQKVFEDKTPITLIGKIRIMLQIAEGLHYAHASKVIHRDIKPANIMLRHDGSVKLMDFGIARLASKAPGANTGHDTTSGQMMGTTMYMAPEQFRGVEADIQTDIFAFGVVCYELLTGLHPFQGSDHPNAVIYRIASIEPAPLRAAAPECPVSLETLIHRAIAKDRGRRYASLDDLVLDLEPIALDLRREEAVRLMIGVSASMEAGDFDRASAELKQALELDPANRDARRVREKLLEQRNLRLLEENIAALEREGAGLLASRQFSDALLKFDGAARLRPGDVRLENLIRDTKQRMLANREASRLVSESKRESHNKGRDQGPYAARVLVLKALEVDPDHPEAIAFLRQSDLAIQQIENEKRLQSVIEEAESLFEADRFKEAIEKLDALDACSPGLPRISDLRTRIRRRQLEEYRRERAERLERGLAEARELQVRGASEQAIASLTRLAEEFPGVPSVENAKAIINQELIAAQRAAGLEAILSGARDMIWNRRLPDAVSVLEGGLAQYPSDAAIEKLLAAARSLAADEARRSTVPEVLECTRSMRSQGNLEAARVLLEGSLADHGQDTALVDAMRVLTLEIELQQSIKRLERYRLDASKLLAAGSPAAALTLLREARSHHPGDPTIEMLLAAADESLAKQIEREAAASAQKAARERFCDSCGTPLPPNARFCDSCGARAFVPTVGGG